ncbi:MAG: hypothetical protein AMJ92_04330 [candidate division Zixibacteria bacterium SM23_81]|nr:MAG: hypothetical protein AMJ92_04330 [candidate division Zixibacteria bacterium SM23_81]
MYRKCIFLLVSLSFILYLSGCTSMRYISKEEIPELKQGARVRVTMEDGTQYNMKDTKVEDSKLVGYIEAEGYKEIDSSEIASLEIKKLDQAKTIALGVFGVVGAVVLIGFLSNGGDGDEPCPT